jgi:hypothetical protein
MAQPAAPRIEPVRKSVDVSIPPDRAFAFFTERMDAWWPFDGHSLFGVRARGVAFEPRAGGSVCELSVDGQRNLWGRLLDWDPPRGFRMTWHPGREAAGAQELMVRFHTIPEGTRVELVHRGWETLAGEAEEARRNYDRGWDTVLHAFVAASEEPAR